VSAADELKKARAAYAAGHAHRDPKAVKDAVTRIIAAAQKVAKPVCVMVASAAEAKDFAGLGASAFIISSDQGQMRRAAAQTLTDFRNLVQTTDGHHVSQQ